VELRIFLGFFVNWAADMKTCHVLHTRRTLRVFVWHDVSQLFVCVFWQA